MQGEKRRKRVMLVQGESEKDIGTKRVGIFFHFFFFFL